MDIKSGMKFEKPVYTLHQILAERRRKLPTIVRTRNKLESFIQDRCFPEGQILYVETEVEIDVVRIKVLQCDDEAMEYYLQHKANQYRVYDSLEEEELFIPLKCPGKLKFVPFPGRRQRYVRVSQIIDDKPRYIKSNDDVMTVPPRGIPDRCTAVIPKETIIEPKEIVTRENGRYLKLVDAYDRCYFLHEECEVNFTGVNDENEYIMSDIIHSGILLPAVIRFVSGTILLEDLVVLNEKRAQDILLMTTLPLELVEVQRRKMLLAKVRQSDKRCFKTLLLPETMYEKFHVNLLELGSQCSYFKRKFGGSQGHNSFIHNKMYVMPTSNGLVCWVQSPRQRQSVQDFQDSSDTSDSDSGYEIPQEPESIDEIQKPEIKHLSSHDEFDRMHRVVLLPQSSRKEPDLLDKFREKTRLGFDKVHAEMKRFVKVCKPLAVSKRKRLTSDDIVRVDGLKDENLVQKIAKPVLPLPGESDLTPPSINVYPKLLRVKSLNDESTEVKRTAQIRPLKSKTICDRVKNEDQEENHQGISQRLCKRLSITNIAASETRLPPTSLSAPPVVSSNMTRFINEDDHVDENKPNEAEGVVPKTNTEINDFFNYNVEQLVESLRYCGMDRLAVVCEEQHLDGKFFKQMDETDLKNIFDLSNLELCKLKRIYDGWRPRIN